MAQLTGLQLLTYLSLIVCLTGIVYKIIKLQRMPLHIRWELYPIPHEKGKGDYGGSYFEELDWWTKPANFSLVSEVKAMAKEILFVHSLFHKNRSLWYVSFPFHFGLYLLIGFTGLILAGALLNMTGSGSTGFAGLLNSFTVVIGAAGWTCTAAGALGLFLSRIFRKELRPVSVWTDYLNVLLLFALAAAGLAAWATVDPSFHMHRAYIQSLLSFEALTPLPAAFALQISLTCVFLLYLPFTHMTHFIGKYFTYHNIRWEDHPNIRGGKIEKAITEVLGYTINWSAPHIQTGKTWAEAATATDEEDK